MSCQACHSFWKGGVTTGPSTRKLEAARLGGGAAGSTYFGKIRRARKTIRTASGCTQLGTGEKGRTVEQRFAERPLRGTKRVRSLIQETIPFILEEQTRRCEITPASEAGGGTKRYKERSWQSVIRSPRSSRDGHMDRMIKTTGSMNTFNCKEEAFFGLCLVGFDACFLIGNKPATGKFDGGK